MEKIVSSKEMKALERTSMEATKETEAMLIERAASALLRVVLEKEALWSNKNACFGILSGIGNNGADALALTRMLMCRELPVKIKLFVIGNEDLARASEGWKEQWEMLACIMEETHSCHKTQVSCTHLFTDRAYTELELAKHMEEVTFFVDGMFGIGLSRPVSGMRSLLCDVVRKNASPVLAIDIPSGIHADTGQVLGNAIPAMVTVTFQYKKCGQVLEPARSEYCGELLTADIGLTGEENAHCFCSLEENVIATLPRRYAHSHKGIYGNVGLVGGVTGMAGAVLTAGMAAYRSGCGLVTIFSDKENRIILQTALGEAVYQPWQTSKKLLTAKLSSIVIGPGLGTTPESEAIFDICLKELVRWKQENGRVLPVVLDADALNLLAEKKEYQSRIHDLSRQGVPIVLTPHLLELARLLSCELSEVTADLIQAALRAAQRYQAICVAKDSTTVIATPKGEVFVNDTGNHGMATGGSGDALAGLLGSLLAQKMQPEMAAVAAVWLHGKGGELATKKWGARACMARDIVEGIGQVLHHLDEENRK